MKKLWSVFVHTLAINFLLLAGAAGWLWRSARVDRPKVEAVRDVLFPKAADAAPGPTTQPGKVDAGPPLVRLDQLLARHAGKRAGEQVEIIQQTFDAQSALLDRRKRELQDLQVQVAAEQKRLADASAALDGDRKDLAERRLQAEQAAADKGFADSLKLYSTMPGKQAKAVFMDMPDEAAARFLQAMPPRTATKIVKEFKTSAEVARINRVLERIRQGGPVASGQPATKPAGAVDGAAQPPAAAADANAGAAVTGPP
jgi:flagellar motility protein MotE (MotC chaperone)